ncbi:unnamed protein product [Ectocarpus sp. 12 AP-2014]
MKMRSRLFPPAAGTWRRRPSRPLSSPPTWLWLMLTCFFGTGGWPSPLLQDARKQIVSAVAAPYINEDESHGPRPAVRRLASTGIMESSIRQERPFSGPWMKGFVSDEPGCGDRWRTVGYRWQQEAGVITNLNNLLETWVYAVVARQREDVMVVDESGILDNVSCEASTKGNVKSGMDCIWAPIPHLCLSQSQQEWETFMRTRGAAELGIRSATSLTFDSVQKSMRDNSEDWLRELGLDLFRARQFLSNGVLWNHVQPWVKKDMNKLLNPTPDEIRQGPFIALHVSDGQGNRTTASGTHRGATMGTTHVVGIEEYLHQARHYLQLQQQVDELLVGAAREGQEPIAPGDIRGVWVASDDPIVLEEVRRLTPHYFPGGSVYGWAQKKTEEKRIGGSLSSYRSFVYEFADLIHLIRADVMVGSANDSGVGVVALLRTANRKPRDSSLSVDTC